jgi:hypothetical protein
MFATVGPSGRIARNTREEVTEKRGGQRSRLHLNIWPTLRRCSTIAEVETSNNLAENSMRPVALGRKNWLARGSVKAGPKVAAILSIVESCQRLGLPMKDYLSAVLPGLDRRADHRKLAEVADLTPSRWSRRS